MGRDNITELNAKRTREERSAAARKAGKASGEKRRERKTIREELEQLLLCDDAGKRISAALIERAMAGDVHAFEVIRDTIGEKPVARSEIITEEITVSIEE